MLKYEISIQVVPEVQTFKYLRYTKPRLTKKVMTF